MSKTRFLCPDCGMYIRDKYWIDQHRCPMHFLIEDRREEKKSWRKLAKKIG